MKRVGLLLLLALLALNLTAGEVPVDVAAKAGVRFYLQRLSTFSSTSDHIPVISETLVHRVEGNPCYYVFNFRGGGFVIVSANDVLYPVPGYSFEGYCSLENAPSQFIAWMKQWTGALAAVRETMAEARPAITELWQQLKSDEPWQPQQRGGVAPLIRSNWNQNAPYNEQCPPDPGGPGGHAWAGCVPVCMAQVMYYYRWPVTGTGSYSYTDPRYGTLSADFGATTYDWNNMTNTITSSNPGIAELLYHLGVSCDLVYGPDGSGMYNHKAAYALRTFFKYSPETQYVYRDSTNLDWDSILIAHLDRKMPMYYAGWSVPNIDGHAFVCDGYQDTAFFHFNFGWSGANNGYFYTEDLTPGGYNFKLAQEVIINSYPDTVHFTYPAYCGGDQQFTYLNGSIDDGSGPMKNYQPGATCTWLIDPQPENDSVSSITLTFDEINTMPGDVVSIYNGPTDSSPLLGSFWGDTIPAPLTGTSNKMLLKFNSNGVSGAPGFIAQWKSKIPVWCSGTKTIKADTALISDGSDGFHYHNNSVCRWNLQSASGGPLTIHFNRFETEEGYDFLRIYDAVSGDSLALLSGYYPLCCLPDSVTSPSGKMLLIFMTNGSVTASGWEIFYPKPHTGVGEPGHFSHLAFQPNPAFNHTEVGFDGYKAGTIPWSVTDITGQTRLSGTYDCKPGKNRMVLNLDGVASGLYMFRMFTGQPGWTGKLMVRK